MARRTILPALLLTIVLLGACNDGRGDRRVIGMEGRADTLVVPTLVVWTVTMSDVDAELGAAKGRSDTRLAAVLAVLGQVGVVPGSVHRGAARIERERRYCREGEDPQVRFAVRRTVTFRQDDLDAVETTLDRLVTAADVEVVYHYEVADPEAVMRRLRSTAMDRARARAAALAAHAGLALGEVQSVHLNEDPYRTRRDPRRQELVGVAGPEAQHLETRVSVRYAMD